MICRSKLRAIVRLIATLSSSLISAPLHQLNKGQAIGLSSFDRGHLKLTSPNQVDADQRFSGAHATSLDR